jgi:hypothetical protein
MNTMKILLGATIALLVAGLVYSWSAQTAGRRNAAPTELAKQQQTLAEIRLEIERVKAERELSELRQGAGSAGGATAPTPSASEEANRISEMEALLRKTEEEKAALANDKEKAERNAQVARDEAGQVGQRAIESRDRVQRRARQISEALVAAVVIEAASDEFGAFIVLQVKMPENSKVGSVLGVRRNDGIIGQLRITDSSPEGAIATPVVGTFFGGPIDVKQGDELIVPPQF